MREGVSAFPCRCLVVALLGLSQTARAHEEVKAGTSLGAKSSLFKYCATELNKRQQELKMAIGGNAALTWSGEDSRDGQLPKTWLRSKGNSIEGGTSEIQLNIISKHILGLPG